MKNFFVPILFVGLLTSCASNLSIFKDSGTESQTEKVKGIPFYTQKPVIEQETSYLYDWIELTLIKEEVLNGKIKSTVLASKRIKKDQDLAKLENSLRQLNNIQKMDSELNNVIDIINKLEEVSLQSSDIKSNNIIQNHWKKTVKVDYSEKYYLNSKQPWFGSSSISQKLSSEGTLSEAAGSTDSQIDELVTSIAAIVTPIASVKVAKIENNFGAELTEQIAELQKRLKQKDDMDIFKNLLLPQISFKLVSKEDGYIYTFKKTYEITEETRANTPITFDLDKGNFIRSKWTNTEKESKKEEKPTINLSGTIELPEVDK